MEAVSPVIAAARHAQSIAAAWSTETVDDIVAGAGSSIHRAKVAERLSEAAVEESGIGNALESAQRLRGRILGAMREMAGARTIGLIEREDARGLRRYAKPIGVIAALTPRTAPVASVAVHSLNAIKTRNAIIFCPHPMVFATVSEAVRTLRAALQDLGAPADLIQVVPVPVRDQVDAIVRSADVVVATGSNKTVARALRQGTPGYGGGVGNAIILVDYTADVELAAGQIIAGKAYDNGTSCSAESCVIVEARRAVALGDAMTRHGGWRLDASETSQLLGWAWPEGQLRADVIGRSASEIAVAAGLKPPSNVRVLVVSASPESAHLVSREKLSPILGLVPVANKGELLSLAHSLLEREGKGHSCAIYSDDPARIDEVARHLPVSRIMVNQSTGFGNTGSPQNGMPSTVIVSSGPWGGTTVNDNITWRHFLNYTVSSERIAVDVLDERSLFGRHWDAPYEPAELVLPVAVG